MKGLFSIGDLLTLQPFSNKYKGGGGGMESILILEKERAGKSVGRSTGLAKAGIKLKKKTNIYKTFSHLVA